MEIEMLLLLGLTAIAGGIGMAAGTTSSGKPLEDHPLRNRIVSFLKENPGASITELCETTRTKWGTLQHHLYLLSKTGTVRGVVEGREHRLFLGRKSLSPRDAAGIALLRRGRVMELVKAIRESPGIIQRQITASVSMSRKVFRQYATLLAKEGLVDERTVARARQYYPTPRLDALLVQLGEGVADHPRFSSPSFGLGTGRPEALSSTVDDGPRYPNS